MDRLFNEIYFDENLVLTQIEANTDVDALEILGNLLLKNEYVKDSFVDAIIKREAIFPTGLELIDAGIAIPHTDAEHVNQAALAIGVLSKPIKFKAMGDPENTIETEILFMLAIKEPHLQLQVLQSLMEVFQTKGKLDKLKSTTNSSDLAKIFIEQMNESI